MKLHFLLLLFAGAVLCGAESFRWSLNPDGVRLELAPGAYVYADGLVLQATDFAGEPVPLQSPAVSSHDGMAVYAAQDQLWRSARPLSRAEVTFQGCEDGRCLLVRTITLTAGQGELVHGGASALDGFSVRVKEGFMTAPEFLDFLHGEEKPDKTHSRSLYLTLALILLGGIGLNLTPCVLPMIPVNLAIIGADGGRKGLLRGLVYGAGITLAYGSLGLLVLFAGMRFGELNSHWLFNGVIAGVFFVLSLSLFDLFTLDFSGAQNRIRFADSRGGALWMVLVLGGAAALLSGACVAPVVMGTLLYAAELCSEEKYYGALLPFLLGLGMALPWPLAGYGLKILPKPGAYMVRIKQGFGVLILLFAVYYGYLAIRQFSNGKVSGQTGNKLSAVLADAGRKKRTVCLEFTASWCKNCAAMQRTTLQDDAVKAALKEISLVPVSAENLRDPETEKLLSRFGIRGLPAFVLLTPEGR